MALKSTNAAGNQPSLADQAYRILLDRLVMLEIQPGEPMNEMQLATELGMGRTPIRESLKRLEIDHLVDNYPRQGTFASRIDIGDLAAITEMRLILEPHAAARVASDASPEVRETLAALAKQISPMMSASPGKTDLMEFDLGVHRAIYKAVGNPYLQETLNRLDNLATRLWWSVLDRLPTMSNHVEERVSLLQAIVEGRSEDAANISREHILSFEQMVRAAL